MIGFVPNLTQDAFAAVNSVTITEPVAATSFGANFSIDYTVGVSGPNTATAGTITFTRTGGTADAGTHVYTMAVPGDTSTGAHTITRATLEGDAGFDVLFDGSEYTIVVSITDGGAITDTELVVTADFTAPSFTAAKTASNQITLTWNENVDSALDTATAGNPFTLGGTALTVASTSALNGAGNTQVLTLSGAIPDDSTITVSYDKDAVNGDILDTADTDPNEAPDINNVNVSGIPTTAKTGNGSGCNGDCTEPTLGLDERGKRLVDNGFSYNGKSVDVEYYFTPYPLVTVQTGKQNVAEFKIYDNMGPDSISHFELAFGLANGESIGMSKAVINWDKTFDGIETVTLDDPENVLDNIKVTTTEGSCSDESQQKCLIVKVVHTFRAPLDFNILATNVWDAKRNAWQNYYNHGIEVVGESLNPPKEYDGINKGQIYHLTETSRTTAVDEFDNSWSLEYGVWAKDYIQNKKIVDGTEQNGINRNNAWFNFYKQGQELLAKEVLEQLCPSCSDKEFAEINDIFSYEFPKQIDNLSDSEIQNKMLQESVIAENTLKQIFDSLYPNFHF